MELAVINLQKLLRGRRVQCEVRVCGSVWKYHDFYVVMVVVFFFFFLLLIVVVVTWLLADVHG